MREYLLYPDLLNARTITFDVPLIKLSFLVHVRTMVQVRVKERTQLLLRQFLELSEKLSMVQSAGHFYLFPRDLLRRHRPLPARPLLPDDHPVLRVWWRLPQVEEAPDPDAAVPLRLCLRPKMFSSLLTYIGALVLIGGRGVGRSGGNNSKNAQNLFVRY